MTFSETLRKDNEDILQAILDHPFVKGIGQGNVPESAIAHYIKADYAYLNAFIKIYGLAIAKTEHREDMIFFNEQIDGILHQETIPHQNFCDVIEIAYDDLQGYPLPPTADHYVKHMMYHAQMGDLAEIIGVLLPCPWTYFVIGQTLQDCYQPKQDHPYYQWITYYASDDSAEIVQTMCHRLDELVETVSASAKDKIREAFRKSCQLELAFWDMAYTTETWETNKKG